MKKYEKPEIKVTSYEAESIMLVSGAGVQKDVQSVKYSAIEF
jgi:hypothetical protein